MKSIRRLAALLLALALVAAACGDDDDGGDTTATTAAATTTTAAATTTAASGSLDEYLVEPGTLTLVTTGNFPPFTLINAETGDVEGYTLDVGREVATRLGLELATPTVDFVAELEGLQAGLYDIADSGIWPTTTRQETFIFTRPMTSAGFIALVRAEDAGAAGLDGIVGKAGAIQGSIHEQWTIENEGMLGYDEYVPFAGAAEAELALKQGRIDVWVIDSLVGAARALGDPELEVTGPTLNAHPLSMTFRPDSEALRDAINPVLDAMIADGTLAEFQVRWFGRCIEVPDDINSAPPYTTLPGGDCPSTDGGDGGTAAPDLSEYLVEPGKLTLVTTGNFPPFTLINAETGAVEGYTLDVGREVATRLGLELATPTVDFVAELEGLQAGLYDIADSGIWPTTTRQETFIFTRPMTSAGFIALVRAEDAGAAGLDGITGKAGAIQGSIHEQWTLENEAMLGYDEYVPFAGAAEAELALKQGRIDVWVIDSLVGAARALGDPELEVTGPTLNAHPLSMTFRPDSEALRDAIDPILDEMIADGALASAQVRWFGRCIEVPDDINSEPPYTRLPAGNCP